MAIAPGEETTVSLEFTMHRGMGGPHEFRVHLRSDDPLEPEKVLVVKSDWR
jgi:hypothetical protein